jgi:hypothetical protein
MSEKERPTEADHSFRIRLPEDPEALRLLEAREEQEGGEPACLLPRLCPDCDAPLDAARGICPECGAKAPR